MQKDKIIKISLIFVILFFIGIFIVSASDNITLRCTSDYGDFLTIAEDADIIDAEFFNQENMMVLNYKILSGFSEIKDSNLKVRLDGLGKYDEGMINSCIKLFHKESGMSQFSIAINYRNYLNYSEKIDASTVTGDMLFPLGFKIILYSDITGEEIRVLERDVAIEISNRMDEVKLILEPYDTSNTSLYSIYSFLQEDYDETLGINVYTYDLAVGAWEDEKYLAFDYYLFDNSSPRVDLKSVSSYANSFDYYSEEPLDGFSIELTDTVESSTLEGNKKIVFKYERQTNKPIDKSEYIYYLYFTDINGKVTTAKLIINFKQLQRVSYMEGLSSPELAKTAKIKEYYTILKSTETGNFNVIINTYNYRATKVEIYDTNFNLVENNSSEFDIFSSRIEAEFKDLDTGWYNVAIYSDKSKEPSNFYSFYFQKEAVRTETFMYYKGEVKEIQTNEVIEIDMDGYSDWFLFDTSHFIGDRELLIKPNFYFEYSWDYSKFDDYFAGAAYFHLYDNEYFNFSINKIGNDYDVYTFHLNSVNNKYDITLTPETDYLYIPEEGEYTSMYLDHSIKRSGIEVEDRYAFKLYYKNQEIAFDEITVYPEGTKNILMIDSRTIEGEYILKLYLVENPEISVSTTLYFLKKGSSPGIGGGDEDEKGLVLKILNENEIAVPDKQGYKNRVYLEGRVIEDGTTLNETGYFSLLSNVEGVSLSSNTLTVLSSANVGDTFDVKFSFRDKSITKTFILVKQDEGNSGGIVDEEDNPIGKEPVSRIELRGFDSDKLEKKYLTFPDTSGEFKTLTYTCYNADGTIVQNPDLKITGSDVSNGFLVVPNYSKKSIIIYANGLFENRDFNLTFVSDNQTILSQDITACKPNSWDCYLDFDTYKFIRNSSFSASGSFSSFLDTETNISLVLILYDKNNKILKYDINTALVKPGETKDFKAKFLMPAEIDDITVKAYFINGTNISDSSKLYTRAKSITNAVEVN